VKSKVVEINPQRELLFPPGDPRNDMTLEEIAAFAEQEESTINRHLAIMAKNTPPPNPVQEEDDEDDEEFELDLKNGIAKQTVGEGLIVKPNGIVSGDIIIKGDFDGDFIKYAEPLKPLNPFEGIITETLVAKSIYKLAKKMEEYYDSLAVARNKAPLISDVEALDKQMEKYYDKILELKRSIKHFPDSGVDYDKVPEWAVKDIERNVRASAKQLADLLD
jgi:hypothetical protein